MSAQFETKIDFTNPIWNRDTWARIQGDLNPENQKIGDVRGVIIGVKPGEKSKELCGFEAFLATRLVPQEDGTIRRLNKEVIFYTNPRTGEIIEEWTNPWTGEVVNVVQVANDPFNYTISEWLILAPEDFGGDKKPEPRKIPLIFPWNKMSPTHTSLSTDMHLHYTNAMNPEKWVRESSGPMVQVSEMMRYCVPIADVENPKLTSVSFTGSWNRITPWMPWMLMGQESGHTLYVGSMTGGPDHSVISQQALAYAEKNYPQFLSAPTEDYGPSHSSLEIYAQTQEPAPPREAA
jgi:hypothetical protein